MASAEPKGDPITGPPARQPDPRTTLSITKPNLTSSITLIPLHNSHSHDLFLNVCGPEDDHLHTYMLNEPHQNIKDLSKHIDNLITNPAIFPFVILSSDTRHVSNQQKSERPIPPATAIGIITLMNIVPLHRSLEIGHVLFPSTLQRTTAATEVCYLLMKHAFEELGFLRVEWKTNGFNVKSRRAAERLGFVYEGRFRKHMVVKGRRRDTDWFSVIDDEWFGIEGGVGVRDALEGWLGKNNFDEGGFQKRKLESFRELEVDNSARS